MIAKNEKLWYNVIVGYDRNMKMHRKFTSNLNLLIGRVTKCGFSPQTANVFLQRVGIYYMPL
jgi:hypothetical protein